ncbi:MAG: 3-5 exonuclease, PolB-like protein [Myxococcales bacterium]|nr:3-5 exonuclease, PolB-like protein [Myxococcales bacterium]
MSSRGYLVLDIETIPDPDLYKAPDQPSGSEKPFPPLYAHRPIVIGVLWLDEQYGFRRIGVIGDHDDEFAMLSDYSSFVEQYRPHIVTFNGRSFDLPVIMLRCLRHGVPLHFFFNDKDYRYRYTDAGHIDLYDFLSEHGAARVGSLDAVAHVIGLPGKVGVDGSQVEGLYHSGQIQLIKDYCLMDVAQTAFVLLRYRLLQGALDRDSYRRVATALFEALAVDGRVLPVLERVDKTRLLLG